ncbi:Ankyrin-3 [Arthrobotrys entomopaga]|nr:Ankyrin-3 [Arthrobotrys entomopaga]
MADPLSIAASVIAVIQATNAVLTFCYRFHMQAKDSDKEIFQVITELEDFRAVLTQIEEVLPPKYIKYQEKEDENIQGTLTCDVQIDPSEARGLERSLNASQEVLQGISDKLQPFLKKGLLAKLKWPFEGKVIQERLENIQRQKSTLQLFLSIQHAKLLGEQSIELLDQKLILGKVRDHADKARRTEILQWYKTSDPEQNHKISREHHQPKTCEWVFETESYQSWEMSKQDHIWINGIPGAGKTIICSTIIDRMQDECKVDISRRVLYYYFDFADAKKQSLDKMLQSLIYQILVTCLDDLPETAALLFDKHQGLQEPTSEELFHVFKSIASDRRTLLFIDALDECPRRERERFFQLFVEKLDFDINLLITSRREPDLEKAIGNAFKFKISIEDAKVDGDVRAYITNAIATDPAFKSWTSAAVKKEVLDAIVKGSRGMFRWAVCQLDTMKQCFTPRMIRQELGRMPKTLDQTYDRILEAIPAMHQTFVQSALKWLAFSERPLLLDELGEAAVIDPSFGTFEPEESRFLDPEKVLELCGPLVTLGTKTFSYEIFNSEDWLSVKFRNECSRRLIDMPKHGSRFRTVTLSHYSVKEYLTSDRLQRTALGDYYTTANMAHRFIAECSLLYLLDMGKGQILDNLAFREFPLLEYTAVNWMSHYKLAGEEEDSPATDLLFRFFDDQEPSAYINWLNSYDPDYNAPSHPDRNSRWSGDLKKNLGELVSPLYWAAHIGFVSVARRLIDGGADVNGSDRGYFGSPLAVAAFYGYEKMVEYLLESEADPNGRGGNFDSVLQAAAAGGYCKLVERLVKAGADVGKIGGMWNTPLIAAATFGHDDVVAFLLKCQADLNVSSATHGTALYQAALAGDVKTVTKLLAAGSDINAMGPQGTPIYAAALSGSLQVVQTLLNRGANVNKGGRGEWGYPLTAAAQQGNVSLVKALLRAGAKVNAQRASRGGRGVTALEAAIESRNMATFQAVFDAGGDPNIQGYLYPNGLYAALWTGELEMAKVLLRNNAEIVDLTFLEAIERYSQDSWFFEAMMKRKANIDAHRGERGCALQVAMNRADEKVVRLLLEQNPYLDAVCEDGSVLVCAIQAGMIDVAKELIKRGVDIKRELPKYSYAFTASVYYADEQTPPDFELVDMLLAMGADVNGGERRSLGYAIKEKRMPILEYLTAKGIDINAVLEFDECTPLQLAALNGDLTIIKALVNGGADLNPVPGVRGALMHYALISGKEEVVRYFINAGTKVEDSVNGWSLICYAFNRGLTSLIPELVRLGADVNGLDGSGWTPLAMAIKECNEDIEKLLRDHGASAANTGADGVIKLASSGKVEQLRKLLDEGVDPNQVRWSDSPINVAIKGRKKEVVETLIEYGASVNPLPGEIHRNPLGLAAEGSDIIMIEYLLQMGADPNESKSGFNWALAQAAKKGNLEVVQLLLDNGADVTAHDFYAFGNAIWGGEKVMKYLFDNTSGSDRERALNHALQSAAYYVKLDICNTLIGWGADICSTGGAYGSPLHAVISNRHVYGSTEINNRKAIFNMFLERLPKPLDLEGGEKPCLLVVAIAGRMLSLVMDLLNAGADPNGRGNEDFDSPLQAAAQIDSSFLKPLIDAGADVNAVGGRFGTALHVAAYAHDTQAIATLLNHGARTDLMSPKYGGVIQAAAKRDSVSSGDWVAGEASVRAMQLLQSRGAAVNASGGRYGNALQLAAKSGNFEGVKWLLSHGADPHAKGRWGRAVDAAILKKKWQIVSYLEQHYGR